MSIFRRFLFIYLFHLHNAFQRFKTILFLNRRLIRMTQTFLYSKQAPMEYIQASVQSYENSPFWTFFNSSITASLISTTSAKWSISNFIPIWGIDMTLSSLFSGVKECGKKTCTQYSLSEILFHNPKSYSLGHVQRFCYHYCCKSMAFFI